MARKKAEEHFLKFFYIRWLMSETVQGMNFTARGIYWELLVRQYVSNTGDLPGDSATLRRMIGAGVKEWKAFGPYLENLFPSNGNHRRANVFMDSVRVNNQERLKAIKEASLKGVEARNGSPNGVPDGAPHGQPNGTPDGQPKRKEKNYISNNSNLGSNTVAGGNSSGEGGKPDGKKYIRTTGTGVFWPDGREKTLEEIRMAHR